MVRNERGKMGAQRGRGKTVKVRKIAACSDSIPRRLLLPKTRRGRGNGTREMRQRQENKHVERGEAEMTQRDAGTRDTRDTETSREVQRKDDTREDAQRELTGGTDGENKYLQRRRESRLVLLRMKGGLHLHLEWWKKRDKSERHRVRRRRSTEWPNRSLTSRSCVVVLNGKLRGPSEEKRSNAAWTTSGACFNASTSTKSVRSFLKSFSNALISVWFGTTPVTMAHPCSSPAPERNFHTEAVTPTHTEALSHTCRREVPASVLPVFLSLPAPTFTNMCEVHDLTMFYHMGVWTWELHQGGDDHADGNHCGGRSPASHGCTDAVSWNNVRQDGVPIIEVASS